MKRIMHMEYRNRLDEPAAIGEARQLLNSIDRQVGKMLLSVDVMETEHAKACIKHLLDAADHIQRADHAMGVIHEYRGIELESKE
jgi:hypothetical protein